MMLLPERVARHRRKVLAEGFEAVLRDAHAQPLAWTSPRAPIQREQVLEAEPEIERLIGRLRGGRPIADEQLRLARALLMDRGSPVFETAAPGALRRRVRVVCEAMG